MGKNQSASNLTNIIQYNNGNISFVSGSTTLMQISSSGAITTTGVISGSNALSASYAQTGTSASYANTSTSSSYANSSSYAATAISASYATSASFAYQAQTASSADSLTVRGTLTAQTLVVQTITSSVSTITGSTSFGSIVGNTHQFTGSVSINPSLYVANFLQSGSYPLSIAAFTEAYNPGSNSYKSSYVPAGTAVQLSSQISTFTGSSAFLFDINAYSQSAATNVYFGAVAGTTGNGPANFVIGRRIAVSTWNESLRIDTSGNVGIGTSSPGSRLTVRGTDSNSMLYLGISGSSANGEAVGITFGSATYDKARIVAYNENSGNAAGYLTLWTGGSPTTTDITERMRITSTGNVGIGTTGPNTRLQILGSSLTAGDQSTYALGIGNSSGYDLTLGTNASYAYIQSWTSRPLSINSQGNNVVFPNASTNIGIGTTNPIVKFDIWGSSTDSVKFRVRNTDTNGSAGLIINPEGTGGVANGDATIFYDVNSTAWVAGVDKSDSSKFKISNDVYGDFRANNFFTIRTNGNVGIGTTNPSKNLEVASRMSTQAIVSGGIIAGNIASNMPSSPAYIPIFNLAESAGFSLTGFVNAASYTCFNMSQIYIRKQYTTSTINAGITGFYKSACDFSIVNITYSGATYVALRFTGDPEIDVVWTGYLLTYSFNSDGSAQVWTSGVTLNSTYASY